MMGKRVKTIGQRTARMDVRESRNEGGGRSSERSTSRNDEERTEGARNGAVVILLWLSVSRYACVGRARAKKKRLKEVSYNAVIESLRRLVSEHRVRVRTGVVASQANRQEELVGERCEDDRRRKWQWSVRGAVLMVVFGWSWSPELHLHRWPCWRAERTGPRWRVTEASCWWRMIGRVPPGCWISSLGRREHTATVFSSGGTWSVYSTAGMFL